MHLHVSGRHKFASPSPVSVGTEVLYSYGLNQQRYKMGRDLLMCPGFALFFVHLFFEIVHIGHVENDKMILAHLCSERCRTMRVYM